jgi:predicted nucleotidyltransferase
MGNSRQADYEQIRKDIEEHFVSLAQKCFGADLHSILLYGSAARGTYRKGISDVNLLILLRTTPTEKLFQFGKESASLIRKRRITPLLMTQDEFLQSADVFPLEYLDIRNAHKVLYGPDDTSALDLTNKNLRHQTEERLRGSLNQLRQIITASEGNRRLLIRLLRSWSGGGNALFRALLALKGKDPNLSDPEALIHQAEELYQVSPGAWSNFERFRRGEKRDPLQVAGRLIESLEGFSQGVDSLTEES